jgi:DNA-binding transcriptional LysR family regulator
MCTIGPLRFVGFLNVFRERHSGIEVSVVESVPAKLSDLLLAGGLDVALMAQPVPFDVRFNAEPLYAERFGLAFPAGHRFEQQSVLRVTDVAGQPYLSRINCEYRNFIGELCDQHGVEVHSAYRSEREDWIMAMIAAGMGVSFMPEYSATQPGVCHRPVANPDVVRTVSIVSVKGRPLSPAASTFTQAVRDFDWDGNANSAAAP